MKRKKGPVIVVAHAGVGSNPRLVNDGTDRAVKVARRVVKQTGSALKGAVAGAVVLEDDPRFNAGTGSYFRLDGKSIEMDAAVMDSDGHLAAVACIQRVKNPVKVAEALLATPHVFLCGAGAADFARLAGFPDYDPITPKAQKLYRKRLRQIRMRKLPRWAVGMGWQSPKRKYLRDYVRRLIGTISVVATDGRGNFAVAASTGGTSLMWPGRVGDTPLVGSGFYAGKSGAVAATGVGEEIIKKLLCREVYERMREGLSPQQACNWGLNLFPTEVPVGLIAVSADDYGIAANEKMASSVLKE